MRVELLNFHNLNESCLKQTIFHSLPSSRDCKRTKKSGKTKEFLIDRCLEGIPYREIWNKMKS